MKTSKTTMAGAAPESADADFSLARLIRDQASSRGDAAALIFNDEITSYREVDQRSNQLANALAARGVGAGDRIAILARNSPVFYEAVFACSKLGAVLVALNWRLSTRELNVIIPDSDSRVHLVDDEFVDKLDGLDVGSISLQREYEAMLKEQPATDPGLVPGAAPIDHETTVLQLYSSGTTGLPKGILITNGNLSKTAESAQKLYLMDESSTNLVIPPLFHIGGIGYGMNAVASGGRTLIAPAADAETLVELISEWNVTHSFMVPAMVQLLVDSPLFTPDKARTLECIAFGGAPMSEALYRRAAAALSCRFTAVYGMTETAGTVVGDVPNPLATEEDRLRSIGTCGRPLPWMGEIAVFDPETSERCMPGVTGEIWVRSQQVTPGYWKRPDATAESIRPDGWFRTGDAACADERGNLYLKDRLKDMIITGGENVFPAEVESVIDELDDVAEVAVIGVASQKWGETVKAVIVRKPDSALTEEAVIAYARENLAHYKCPTSVDFMGELPRNGAGKVLKPVIRSWYDDNGDGAR